MRAWCGLWAPCQFLVIVAVMACTGALSTCSAVPQSDPSTTVTMAVLRESGGAYHAVGVRLAQIYESHIPRLRVQTRLLSYTTQTDAVQQGDVDLAFIGGDTAYFAHRAGTEANPTPHSRLRGIAALFPSAVQIVARVDSGIHRVGDLRGRRVGVVGLPGSEEAVASETILKAHGLHYEDADVLVRLLSPFNEEMAAMVQDGRVDSGFLYRTFPTLSLTNLAGAVDVRLIPIEQDEIETIQTQYPFWKSITIPRGTYVGQADDIRTIGIATLLVCSSDLSESLVYALTEALFEGLPELIKSHAAAADIDPERGPTTPIPLHRGAALYYRERELTR